jgi:hypothetical protein
MGIAYSEGFREMGVFLGGLAGYMGIGLDNSGIGL